MQTDEEITEQPRPARRAEYWEQLYERFPGATVLDDLERFPSDVTASRWILVRYAAVRAVSEYAAGPITARELRIERNIGLNHLASVPMLDREAWSLRKMLDALSLEPPVTMVTSLVNAAAAAVQRDHVRGAYAMFHCAYKLALKHGWPAEGGRAARGIERLALEGGAVYSPRLWRRRAKVMERRAAVA